MSEYLPIGGAYTPEGAISFKQSIEVENPQTLEEVLVELKGLRKEVKLLKNQIKKLS